MRSQWSSPSEHSVLCSKHFSEDCFQPDSAIAVSVGQRRRSLKPDAVPTHFERQSAQLSSSSTRKRSLSTTPLATHDAQSEPKKGRGRTEVLPAEPVTTF